ncbi:MAG: tRNA ((37)-N6)-threonylcarbamoyltransferase complex ATPase subunit type 1 TsaE [Pseudomonadota bacterium]
MIDYALDETDAIAARIAAVLRPGDVIGLSGDLGAGKTTLARGMLRALGLVGEAPSPTFAIVQYYDPPDVALPVAHVDLYRVDDAAALAELGLDEARAAGAMLIEWPQRMGNAAWDDMVWLHIDRHGDDARRLTWRLPRGWKDRWPLP